MMTVSVRCELELDPALIVPAPRPPPPLPNSSPTTVPPLREYVTALEILS
jgi:hypothetical protein